MICKTLRFQIETILFFSTKVVLLGLVWMFIFSTSSIADTSVSVQKQYDLTKPHILDFEWYRIDSLQKDSSFLSCVHYLDSIGRKTEELFYDQEGQLISQSKYVYHENGSLLRKEDYHPNGTLKSLHENEYNVWGLLSQSIQYAYSQQNRTILSKKVYKYDKSNRLLLVQTYNVHGDVIFEDNYKYDKSGRLLKIFTDTKLINNKEGDLECRFTYDDAGRLQTEEEYNIDYVLQSQLVYQYNSTGKCTKKISKDPHGKVLKLQFFAYDPQDRMVEMQEIDDQQQVIKKVTFRHN